MYSSDERTIRELISQLREEKMHHTKEIGALRLGAQRERERTRRCESELLDLKAKLDFRLKQVSHLKAALKSRDKIIQELEGKLESLTNSLQAGNCGREEAIKDSLQEAHRKLDAMQSYVDKLSGNLTKITDGLHMKGKLEPSNNSEEQIFNTQCNFHEERLIQRSSDRVLQMLRQQQEHEQGQDLHELLVLSKSLS